MKRRLNTSSKKKRRPRNSYDRRNYDIFRLRGVYQLFSEINCKAGLDVVDEELRNRGAETETHRRMRHKLEREAEKEGAKDGEI